MKSIYENKLRKARINSDAAAVGLQIPYAKHEVENLPKMPCDCGSNDASWHGSRVGLRMYLCDDCAKYYDL